MLNKLSQFIAYSMIMAVMTVASFGLTLSAAHAQEKSIAIVDLQYIMRESDAAKSVQKQISKLRDSYKSEISKEEESLKSLEQALLEKRAILSADKFEQERKSFEQEVISVQKDVRAKQIRLDEAFSKAMDKIKGEAVQLIAKEADEMNVDLVLPRQNIIIVDQSLDITEKVVKQLNDKLSQVDVEVE